MLNQIIDAKKNNKALVFEKYQIPKIVWEDVLLFLYKDSLISNDELTKKVKKVNNFKQLDSVGNVIIQNRLWLSPQTYDIFKDFNGVSELLYKLNNLKDNSHCDYYKNNSCSCDTPWHFQGIRMSLSNHRIVSHHDPRDILYWQILGTSFWKANNEITYTLNPGDLFYLPKESSHQVWCDGPRAGLLIDNLQS
jgi:hypothetical protein